MVRKQYNQKSLGTISGASVLSAFAASLCCITPVFALLAGSSSIATNFSWIEPARPYLMGLSIAVLGFAWYLKLRPLIEVDCNCKTPRKAPFLQSGTFLGLVTIFAVLMMTFPLYAKVFPPKLAAPSVTIAAVKDKQQVKFLIEGMTCEACEGHVNNEVSKVPGVLAYQTSYASENSVVSFDQTKTDIKTIEAAIEKTGYRVIKSIQ